MHYALCFIMFQQQRHETLHPLHPHTIVPFILSLKFTSSPMENSLTSSFAVQILKKICIFCNPEYFRRKRSQEMSCISDNNVSIVAVVLCLNVLQSAFQEVHVLEVHVLEVHVCGMFSSLYGISWECWMKVYTVYACGVKSGLSFSSTVLHLSLLNL